MADTDIVMPFLSETMQEGTVACWLKAIGEHVDAGEPLVEIEADKASMVYESDATGNLVEILVSDGETVPVGQVIGRIAGEG
jgi:pyruvate/2-oxoglutarate dehydrogenase complex dihydrolipoamide acyltransferase (E2) component